MNVLVVTVDAGGNVPPALAIAAELARGGDEVTVLGHAPLRAAVEAAGLAFTAFVTARPFDPRRQRSTLVGLVAFVGLAADRGIGDDAVEVARRSGADVVLVDFLATGGLARVQAAGLPVVSLVHTPDVYAATMPKGPVGLLLRLRGLDLARVQAAVDQRILVSRADLDPVRVAPERTRQVGVVWQGQPVAAVPQDPPRVLVSLSTTAFPGQQRTLQTVLDALGGLPVEVVVTTGPALDPTGLVVPGNATVHRWLDHDTVLPTTSLVVGHGGWSTTTRALAYGVPVLVIPSHPMLDQPMVGAALARGGVGAVLSRRSSAARLAAEVERLLADAAVRATAGALGADIRRRDGAAVAADVLRGVGYVRKSDLDPRRSAVAEPYDDVLEPEQDPGLHHDRRVHGGMPERLDDDALERAVEEDRVAAGLDDYAEADVPPATDPPPPGTAEAVDLAQRGLAGDTTASP